MSIIVCGQDEILRDECPACGGWLDRVQCGGFPGPHGWRFCDPECIDNQLDREERIETGRHIAIRDLLCECEICRERGLPTEAMREEYTAYRASLPRQVR